MELSRAFASTDVSSVTFKMRNGNGQGRNGLARAPRVIGRALVTVYRYTLSPLLGPRCRHLPTCSDYAEQAITRFGLWAGGWMALARIARCNPFGTHGLDFVPAAVPREARWYLPWRYGRWHGTNEVPPR
jgi:putative membrane protein insertion efficiency factor